MTDAEALHQLREQIVDHWAELHHHVDDSRVIKEIQRIGPPAQELVMDLLRSEVDAEDENLASYCVELIIRTQLPGHVDLVLEALSLRFRKGVQEEFWESFFNWANDYPSCYRDPRLIAAAQTLDQT